MTEFRFKPLAGVTTKNHRTEIIAPVCRCFLFHDRIALIFAGMRKRCDVHPFALDDRLTATINRTAEVLDVGRRLIRISDADGAAFLDDIRDDIALSC